MFSRYFSSEHEIAPGSFSVLSPSPGKCRGVCHPPLTSVPNLGQTHKFYFQQDSHVQEAPPCFLLKLKACLLLLKCWKLITEHPTHSRSLFVIDTNKPESWISRQTADHQRCKKQSVTYRLAIPAAAKGLFFVEAGAGWLTEYCCVLGTLALQPHISRLGCLWSLSNSSNK